MRSFSYSGIMSKSRTACQTPAASRATGRICDIVRSRFVERTVAQRLRNLRFPGLAARDENWIILKPQIKDARLIASCNHDVMNMSRVVVIATWTDGFIPVPPLGIGAQCAPCSLGSNSASGPLRSGA